MSEIPSAEELDALDLQFSPSWATTVMGEERARAFPRLVAAVRELKQRYAEACTELGNIRAVEDHWAVAAGEVTRWHYAGTQHDPCSCPSEIQHLRRLVELRDTAIHQMQR